MIYNVLCLVNYRKKDSRLHSLQSDKDHQQEVIARMEARMKELETSSQ